jgi:3-methyladenine DNA glycosylase AlkD
VGKNHELALKLWNSGVYDARILAAHVDDKNLVTEEQMEAWVCDFDSWALCDNTCMHLFSRTPYAWNKIKEWSKRKKDFVKRTAFTLIASLAVHEKKEKDEKFIKFFPIIKKASIDERNFVKKAVNWALRTIGKKNKNLNQKAIKFSKELLKLDSKTANWIAKHALRELRSEKVQKRFINS